MCKRLQKRGWLPTRAPRTPSGRLVVVVGVGVGLGLGLGSWWRASGLIKIFFLDQVKLNVLPFNSEKNDMHFYVKRQVFCLENKNVMHFILSKVLNEIDRVLRKKFRNSTSLDLREILTHVQQLLREVGLLRFLKYRLSSSFIV